jgi:hypothetical protein
VNNTLEDDLILRQFDHDLQVSIEFEKLKRLLKNYNKPFRFSKAEKQKFLENLLEEMLNDK